MSVITVYRHIWLRLCKTRENKLLLLGFVIDSVDMTVALTQEKINKLSKMFTNVLLHPCMSIRELHVSSVKWLLVFLPCPVAVCTTDHWRGGRMQRWGAVKIMMVKVKLSHKSWSVFNGGLSMCLLQWHWSAEATPRSLYWPTPLGMATVGF